MNIVTDYWEQIVAFIILVTILAKVRVDVEVLKEKVKTLFDLWNRRKD